MTTEKIDVKKLVEQVNGILREGEPENISEDTYSGMTGYKPQHVVEAMNTVFGLGGWGFEELSNELTVDEKNLPILAVAQVKVWITGVETNPTAWGQSRVTRGDLGDAHKGAQTDAIKKGLSYFGIGSRAYLGLLQGGKSKKVQSATQPKIASPAVSSEVTKTKATEDQLRYIVQLFGDIGGFNWDKPDVEIYANLNHYLKSKKVDAETVVDVKELKIGQGKWIIDNVLGDGYSLKNKYRKGEEQ